MKLKIRYAGCPHPLEMTDAGEWIDLYTAEDADMKAGDFKLISLGVAMDIGKDYEANIIPRSSTYMKWGIIQSNHFGEIDSSYNGDNDIWKFGAIALRDTFIPAGTRICQFRLNKTMKSEFGQIEFEPVLTLGNADRGGFGSTGI